MELVDVYRSDREKTGRVLPRETVFGSLAEDERVLLVHTCVFDSGGRMLIQHRSTTKDRYPGCWDVSSGGFVSAGEDSAFAAARELREELGLVFPEGSFIFVCCEPFGKVLDDFYIVISNADISGLQLQESEVSEVSRAGRDAVLEMIRDGRFVDFSEELIIKLFNEAGSRIH